MANQLVSNTEGDAVNHQNRRVVVTGMGMLTPVGLTVDTTWSALLAGKSGIEKLETLENDVDIAPFPAQIAGRVKNFDGAQYLPQKMLRRTDTFVQFGIAAAVQAVEDAGLEVDPERASRYGVAIGSGIGGLPVIERTHSQFLQAGPRRISPHFIPGAVINMISGEVSIRFGMQGPNIAIVTACTTGTHNIGYAARTIAYGDADVMLAGGAEMATSALGMGGFGSMRALSTRNDDPQAASRPWDEDRDGFVLGEGAGVLVLEELSHAQARGAKIYAEISGFGLSADAYHQTQPTQEGPKNAMTQALMDAGLNATDVDYINAHGTSTPIGDLNEAQSIKATFGDHAYKLTVSSTKSMIGHLLGAAGAVEAIFSVLAIRDNVAPPTINLHNPSEGCDLDFAANQAKERTINVALSNSFGFGGTNGSLIFSRYR